MGIGEGWKPNVRIYRWLKHSNVFEEEMFMVRILSKRTLSTNLIYKTENVIRNITITLVAITIAEVLNF